MLNGRIDGDDLIDIDRDGADHLVDKHRRRTKQDSYLETGNGETVWRGGDDGAGDGYVDWNTQVVAVGDFGNGDRCGKANQPLVVTSPEEPVAVIAGDERAGVDVARVGHTRVVVTRVEVARVVVTGLKLPVL